MKGLGNRPVMAGKHNHVEVGDRGGAPNEAAPDGIPTQHEQDMISYKLVDLEISCRGPWSKHFELPDAPSYDPG